MLALAGGPGQSAAPLLLDFAQDVRPALRTRDLIAFDQRGTGRSGVLRCPRLERLKIGDLGATVRECAATLGARRGFYTTYDTAEDIEAVRQAVGVERLTLYGTSYGTKVALAYASRYPAHVERLLLDSVVGLDGPDPFMLDVFGAVPRVLRALCSKGACRGITRDPAGDLSKLVTRLALAPIRGRVFGGDGRPHRRKLGRLRLVRILIDGDIDPTLRAELPAAVASALRGDSAPLLRLAHRDRVFESQLEPVRDFSPALFVATTCEEGPLPWQSELPFSHRWGQAISRAGALPDSVFAPFDRATARASDSLRLCAHWPTAGPAPAPTPFVAPSVPTLLLSGEADLRTPQEGAARLAAQIPGATHLVLPGTGHGALVNDFSACAERAVARFFAGRPVGTKCPQLGQLLREIFSAAFLPTPIAPRSVRQLRRAGGLPGRAGRTLAAFQATIADAFFQLLFYTGGEISASRAIGGLRGGRIHSNGRLDHYQYVPGVVVTEIPSRGRPTTLLDDRGRQRFRVAGRAASRGVLTLDKRRFTVRGRLGGRRVDVDLLEEIESELRESRAGAAAIDAKGCCRFVR